MHWIVDSECTAHMTNERDNFATFTDWKRSIQIGNKAFVRSEGVRTVEMISTVDGIERKIVLKGGLDDPILLYNIIIISKVRQNGLKKK